MDPFTLLMSLIRPSLKLPNAILNPPIDSWAEDLRKAVKENEKFKKSDIKDGKE